MTVDVFVLFNASPPTYQELEVEAKQHGFNMELYDTGSVDSKQGYRPIMLGTSKTGFFVTICDPQEIMDRLPTLFSGRKWKNCIEFSSGSPHAEFTASIVLSAVLAYKTSGVIFEPQQTRLYESEEISTLVNLTLKYMPIEGLKISP